MTLETKPIGRPKGQRNTAKKLINAALLEFSEYRFTGTDSNKIAKRAGFAPQTFYRWFKDKTEIFVAAYWLWVEEEMSMLDALTKENVDNGKLVAAIVKHHRKHLQFRRSLRQLAVEDPAVRKARAKSRKHQVERIKQWRNLPDDQYETILIALLQIERLADAVAEGEGKDLGIPDAQFCAEIVALLNELATK